MSVFWKEARNVWPRCLIAIAVLLWLQMLVGYGRHWGFGDSLLETSLRIFSPAFHTMVTTSPSLAAFGAALLLMGLGVALGYDAAATEAGDGTWVFLRSKPTGRVRFALAKLLPRFAGLAFTWAMGLALLVLPLFVVESVERPWMETSREWALWYLWTPPYTVAYAALVILFVAIATSCVAVLVSTITAHRGAVVAMAGLPTSLLVLVPAVAIDVWWVDHMTRTPERATALVGFLVLVLSLLTAYRLNHEHIEWYQPIGHIPLVV